MAYLHKVLVALDEFGNALADGESDETISGRAARGNLRGAWWGRALCWSLATITRTDHCSLALQGDANRAIAELDRDPVKTKRSRG